MLLLIAKATGGKPAQFQRCFRDGELPGLQDADDRTKPDLPPFHDRQMFVLAPPGSRNVSARDLRQRWLHRLEHLPTRFLERDVLAIAGELERQPRRLLLREIFKSSFDTLPLRVAIRSTHYQPGNPFRLLTQLRVAPRGILDVTRRACVSGSGNGTLPSAAQDSKPERLDTLRAGSPNYGNDIRPSRQRTVPRDGQVGPTWPKRKFIAVPETEPPGLPRSLVGPDRA